MINKSKYKLEQTRMSGNIDSDFEYFIPTTSVPEIILDEFISATAFVGDYHNVFINNNSQVAFRSAEIDTALIPDYKTLEVMLVERGLTYDDIRVITNLDNFIYDDLYELDNRVVEWNNVIRFNSGYVPVAPYVRDPGDYITADGYDALVYSKQTWIEKLRVQFEGKLIVLSAGSYKQSIESLRMMIYGEWRPISYLTENGGIYPELDTLHYYNYINEIGADYSGKADPWDDKSILNVFIDTGIITNLNDTGYGSPVWNDFNHYTWNERPNLNYVRQDRYKGYIDITDDNVFELDYMQPYEPAGSEQYYNEYTPWQEI